MARKPRVKEPPPEPGDTEITLEAADTIDPYAVLSIDTKATQEQVKSAYRKAALRHHPDKAQPDDRDEANRKFQEIATAYAILSDEKRRRRYDTTGNVSESLDDDDFNWTDFFREQSQAVVNGDMIQQIKAEYQGSSEERNDVLRAYEDNEGDMDLVYESVMCSNVLEDDDRFRSYISDAIKNKHVQRYAQYANESQDRKRKRAVKARAEEQEAMELAEELGVKDKLFGKVKVSSKRDKAAGSSEDTLKALIQSRQKDRADNFFDRLEAKYGGAKRSKRNAPDEPSEEAFQRNKKKLKERGSA